MMEKADRSGGFFEFKITLGNILSILVLLAAGYAGYIELRTNHFNLDREFREHQLYDDRRFSDYATKESRMARDLQIDKKLDDMSDRIKNIERLMMEKHLK